MFERRPVRAELLPERFDCMSDDAFVFVELEAEPDASALPFALALGETEFAVSLALLTTPLAVASPIDAAPFAVESADEPAPAAVPASPDVLALPEPLALALPTPELALADPLPDTEPALFNTPVA